MKLFCGKYFSVFLLLQFSFQNRLSASDYPVTTYLGIEQGLSNNTVRCIYQDHNGFMWLGTNDGLNRWDGYNFRLFNNKTSDRYPFFRRAVSALNQDAQHNLWIASFWGVSIYNGKTNQYSVLSYTSSKSSTPLQVEDFIKGGIQIDNYNDVFIGSRTLGLLYCKNASFIARQIPLVAGNEKTLTYHVRSVKIGAGNKVWLFVEKKGLCLFDKKSMTVRLVNAAVQFANCIEADGNDIWIGTENGLYQYNIVSNTCTSVFDGKLSSNNVLTLSLDNRRNLWIGTLKEGVNVWDRALNKMVYLLPGSTKYALTSGDIFAIYKDKASRIWVGTYKGGVNIVDPQKQTFQVIAQEPWKRNAFTGNAVAAFFEASDSNLWIGTEDAGINVWDRKKNTFRNYRNNPADPASIPSNSITAIDKDHLGNIWIATYTAGIARFLPSTGNFKHYRCINKLTGLENPVFARLYQDREKIVWAAALRQENRMAALYFYNRVADSFELFDDKLSDLFSITESSDGVLWGGNLDHLVRIDKKAKKHQFYHVGYFVRDIHEDKNGDLWLGSEGGGLYLFDRKNNKIAAQFTSDAGLCNNSVVGIEEDREGNLWLSTLNGLSMFNPQSRTFKNYYKNDGLQSNQFNYGAAIKLYSGELAFGGIKGFTLFQPGSMNVASVARKIFLTDVKVGNLPIDQQASFIAAASLNGIEKIRVPYDKAALSFSFASLEYSVPDKIQYAYYLEGWDRDWHYNGNNTKATYTHIAPGSYTLRVKCTNDKGVWSDKELMVTVIVLPPWYLSWWAYFLYTIILGAMVYYYLQYRSKQTRLQYEVTIARLNAENERVEKEREKMEREKERVVMSREREINEKVVSFFTSISHEFRTPLTLIINPIKDLLTRKGDGDNKPDSEINTVYRNARRMLSLVDQLLLFRKAESGLDHLNPGKLNIHQLAYEVYLCFVQQMKAKGITYNFQSASENTEIYADHLKLEIILYNLLSNALKYTPAGGKVSFVIQEQNDNITLVIKDSGDGISKDVGDKLFEMFYQPRHRSGSTKVGFGIGLYLVKHFTDQHKGRISYESEEGKGTAFTLELFKGKAHFSQYIIEEQEPATPAFIEQYMEPEMTDIAEKANDVEEIITEKKSILIVDDDQQLREYIAQQFESTYTIYQAQSGEEGVKAAKKQLPDLIITDIQMQGISGIDLCKIIKEDASLGHIPVLLLTASTATESKLKGMESGADDYIIKPFDRDLLMARVAGLLKNRTTLQRYFFDQITLNKNGVNISPEYKEFLEKCIAVVENHLDDDGFTVQTLLKEMGMSHSTLLRRVKSISGLSINAFIRFIRLRKAAEMLINTDYNTTQTALMVGFNSAKYFREQFQKVFGVLPSEYIRKYRKTFNSPYKLNKKSLKGNKDSDGE